jgi:hypothetical protein
MLGFPFIFHRENWIKSGSTKYVLHMFELACEAGADVLTEEAMKTSE